MRVESGTCNVCSAPCSSCMHRMAVAGEPNLDCGSSDNKYVRKEIDSYDDLQTAASEISNLLSGSSSNDSYSENAESRATIRNPSTYDASEDVDMLPEVSTVEEDKFLPKDISVEGHEMPCNYAGATNLHSELEGGYCMPRCCRNSDSSMSGTRDDNDVGLDHGLEQAKRDAPCSSSQLLKFSTKETKMADEDTCESQGYGVEGDRVSRRMLSTYHREFFHKKTLSPLNVGFSSLSDSIQKNSIVKLNSTSPCQSDHISSHSADGCNDLEANQPSQFQGASHDCILVKEGSPCHRLLSASDDHGQKIHSFLDIGADKETNIRISSPSGELKNVDPCFESATGVGRCESSLQESGMQHQFVLPGQTSESDNILFDVNVCDICGDAGREELLATCSRCIDGAEHTYCMRIMLTKVPEGDWLCEECQLKEEVETKDLKRAEIVCGASNAQSLDKKIQNLGSYANTENSPRFYAQSTDTEACKSSKRACTPIKEMQIPTPRKRHMHQIDVAQPTRKKITEPTDEHLKLASPRIAAIFSRENSIKNFNVAEVKRIGMASSLGHQSANNSRNLSRSLTLDSRENSFKSSHITELKRASSVSFSEGLATDSSPTLTRSHTLDFKSAQREHYSSSVALSRQVSFKKNVEQKVKKLSEDAPQKLNRDSTSGNTKIMTPLNTFNKSASFKSVSSDHHDDESATKSQSLKSPQAENPKGFKQVKERIVPEKASSTVVVVDSIVPSIKRKYIPKMDLKIAPLSQDSINKFETASLGIGKGFARENRLVHKELKKQLSFKSKSSASVDTGNKNVVESQKCEDIHVNSTASIFSKDAGGVAASSESLSADSHQVPLNEKTKDSSSKSKLATSGVIHESDHAKLREANHSADSCQKARLPASSAKPSADVSSKDGTNKRNRWRDALKATMCRTVDISESRLCSTTNAIVSSQIGSEKPPADVSSEDGTRKRIKLVDALKTATHSSKKIRKVDKCDLKLLSNNAVCEGSLRCSLPSISQKNLSTEEAHIGKRILGNNDTVNSRTNSIDNQGKHLMESSYLHGVGDLNANLASLDETTENNLNRIFPTDLSVQTTTVRSLAMPEHDFIWRGGFEILRIGRLPEVVDGIQAHLSNFASPKVHEVSCQFPSKIQLEEVPRVSLWPSQFQETGPEENNIALYFFAKDSKSYEKSYQKLLETALKSDLAFKGNINELEILIFPSSILPENSQRWNTLFFLWGVFRVRELDCSKPPTGLHDNPSEAKMPSNAHVQDVSSHACEVSTSLKNDSHQNPRKELNSTDESCADKKVEFDSVVDFHGTSSTSLDNDNHETKDVSIKTSLCKAAAETDRKELHDQFPCYRTEPGHTNNEVDEGKIIHIHASSEQPKLARFFSENSVPSGFGQEVNESGEMTEEKNSVKIEPHPEEKLKEVDCLSWDSKPNLKRIHSWSERLYGERLKSGKANKWQDERDVHMEEPEHKRIKYDEESRTSAGYREDQNMGYRSPSNVQPSLTSYLEEKQNGGSVNYSHAMTERSHCIERCFFPVEFCPGRRELMGNFRYFIPPVDEDAPLSNSPDLELALGGKKPSPKKPFFPLVYDRRLDKLSDSTTAKHDDGDISESLSLSLAFPGMERKRTGTPVKRQDPPGVNTSLILFGGFSDT